VAALYESIAGPHQLIAAKKTQPAQSNKRKKEIKQGRYLIEMRDNHAI